MEWKNNYLMGSSYFFKDYFDDFKPKDVDRIIFVENPPFKIMRQTISAKSCLFEWNKNLTAEENINLALTCGPSMQVGKFLVPEICNEMGITFNDLKRLEPLIKKLDDAHKYEEIIYNAYLENGEMTLTEEQRFAAYQEYKKYRKEENDHRNR